MSVEISQKEYLKKYLSGSDVKKKKKKQKINSSSLKRSQIIDDDIDLKNMRMLNDDEVDIYQLDEDGPQIAGIIDERPDEVKAQEYYNSTRWKVFSTDIGSDGITVVDQQKNKHLNSLENYPVESDKVSCTKKQKVNIDKLSCPKNVRENKHLASDLRNSSDSDKSLPRQTLKFDERRSRENNSDSDVSPPRKSCSLKIKESKIYEKRHYSDKVSDTDLSSSRTSKSDCKRDSQNSKYSHSKCNYRNKIDHKNKNASDDSDLPPSRTSKPDYKRDTESSKYSSYSKHNYKNRKNRKDKNKSDDSDLSPPRMSKPDYKKYSESSKHSYSKDNYKNRISNKDKNASDDSDLSPPRKLINERKTSERSREVNKSDSDLSPPRKLDNDRYSQSKNKILSNYNSRRQLSDSDLSQGKNWPRREEKYHLNKQREKRSESGSPRNNRKIPRRQEYYDRHSRSPPRKKDVKEYSKSKRKNSDSDLSPPRNSHDRNTEYQKNKRNIEHDSTKSEIKKDKMEKTLDGKRAGLQAAQNLRTELADFKKKEDQIFSKMNASTSGEGAAPVLRDRKTGKVRDLEAEKILEKEKTAKDDVLKEKYSRWGKGLKQVEDAAERLADAMKEMSKPLARYADDEDLDKFLRAQDREGDPMLDYIKRKQSESVALTGRKPQYQGAYAPNRFGIRPGHRWDGVDRSNGFEKKWFTQQNSRKARDEEAYKWSTSDM